MHVQAMINSHPRVRGTAHEALSELPEIFFDCAQTCTACADACLGEEKLDDLRQCIRSTLDCADVCLATGNLAIRRTGSDDRIVELMLTACAEACRACGVECARHGVMLEHCRICAEVCRSCEQACIDAVRTMEMH
jgi:hypothetical protein